MRTVERRQGLLSLDEGTTPAERAAKRLHVEMVSAQLGDRKSSRRKRPEGRLRLPTNHRI
jgi:hypothetical protein